MRLRTKDLVTGTMDTTRRRDAEEHRSFAGDLTRDGETKGRGKQLGLQQAPESAASAKGHGVLLVAVGPLGLAAGRRSGEVIGGTVRGLREPKRSSGRCPLATVCLMPVATRLTPSSTEVGRDTRCARPSRRIESEAGGDVRALC
jgi:hypothetical protein